MSNKMSLIPHAKNPVKHGPNQAGAAFEAYVSPESFKHNMNLNFNTDNVANSAVDVFQFKGYGAEDCSFKMILDGTDKTAPSEGDTGEPVGKQIKSLTDTIYKYQGSIHKPYYVEVIWNRFQFYGNCKSMNVDYTLFDRQGLPLLAEVDLSFMILRDPEQAHKVGMTSSPDMTHVHTFKAGDNLTSICDDIYDDPSYYIQIAQLNKISNFRNIKPGTKVIFPPLVNLSDV